MKQCYHIVPVRSFTGMLLSGTRKKSLLTLTTEIWFFFFFGGGDFLKSNLLIVTQADFNLLIFLIISCFSSMAPDRAS